MDPPTTVALISPTMLLGVEPGIARLEGADVPVDQSALLLIDAQDGFRAHEDWGRRDNHDFEANTTALIWPAEDAARAPG
jgi:hypothetical protein